MSAAAFGAQLPANLTLDDLAAMSAADEHGHRYEMSPEGVLSVMPPANAAPATIASRLFAWFLAHGWSPERVLQNCGLLIKNGDNVGGRVPDLTVWSTAPKGDAVWAPVTGLLLAVEIVSRGSEAIDQIIKKGEYEVAGVPRYWVVNKEAGNPVTMWQLGSTGYREVLQQPLAWLLNTSPEQHVS
jgi:Uma2 family endonuclease